ncbi:MAG: hypothetical protein QOK43_1067 [Acidimicrobiaceae bacterium]|nr:hypothetical protein [Acidimicrobiaceae bacterium]
MLERLPERVRSRPVAKAMFSPSATLLAGAGVSVAVLAGAPVLAAAAVGALCWVGRVAWAVPRKRGEQRVEPGKVREPWRRFVVDAIDARRRFEQASHRTRPGPLRDRLTELGRRLDSAVDETWRIARQGDALQSAYSELDVGDVQQELASLGDEAASPSRDAAMKALQAQLAAAARIERVAGDARDRLRVLNARLDEAVARAVELSVGTMGDEDLLGVSNQVDSLVGEMESLREALEDTGERAGGEAGGEAGGTPMTSGGGSA